MSTARPSKSLEKAVRQYADDLTASVRAVASDHLQHFLQRSCDAERGVRFQYGIIDAPFASSVDVLALTVLQTIVPRNDPDHPSHFSIASYAYHLRTSDGDGLLRWEFQPAMPPSWPHLHLDAGDAAVAGTSIDAHHLPTGRVLLEDVLRYLVHDCGVEPAAGYDVSLSNSETWFDQSQWGTARGHRGGDA